MDAMLRKKTGSYYTCNTVADYIARWAINDSAMCVLEPSFGDGIFIDSAICRFAELGNKKPLIVGVEIRPEPYELYMSKHTGIMGSCMNFLDYRAQTRINAVVGNPPYVSLKNLETADKEKALALVRTYGIDMQTSGSLWMPFVIHATEILEENGKLGFVLPYEITYVRYAFELWKYLSKNYGRITICRVFRDFFPAVDVETVVFLAENKGMSTNVIDYNIYETTADLFENNAYNFSQISINDIIRLEKPFERNLLPGFVTDCLNMLQKQKKLKRLVQECKFKIGYVSGHKGFFHPTKETTHEYGISLDNMKKSLLNAKQLSANTEIGIETKGIKNYSYLFYPTEIGIGEKQYIQFGEKCGINNGYKCRVRNPWYLTQGLEIPDVILTVFGDTPKLMLNDGEFYVSNSLLSGFTKTADAKELVCRWYNSLTLLSIETMIHSLGGGTLVFIPGETDKLEIISNFPTEKIVETYTKLSCYAKAHTTEEIYSFGDNIVLKEIYGFSDEMIMNIRTAIAILRDWRNPGKRRGCDCDIRIYE